MSDWYCVKKFPIPFDKHTVFRGIMRYKYEPDPQGITEYVVEISEWTSLGEIEPTLKGEEYE